MMTKNQTSPQWPIVGHEWAVHQMQIAIQQDTVPHALLFTGPENIGKMTLAHTLAAALLCKGEISERPCGKCLSCRKLDSGNHPDFMLVEPENATSSLKIDQIRALERFLALTPNESTHKIALINAFERATISAANALLKTLEEPPAYAHLILLAQDANTLLPTIVSRALPVNLRPLPARIVKKALVEHWKIAPDQAERLARISGGRIGWAVHAATAPDYQQQMDQAITTLLEILHQDLPTRFETAKTLTKSTELLGESLAYWLGGWRDVLLLQTHHENQLVYQEHATALREVAQKVKLQSTVKTIKTLERAQIALARNANTLLLAESLLLTFPTLS